MKLKRSILNILIIIFLSTSNTIAQSQERDFDVISEILFQQEKDWNNGNVDAFMKAYWQSEELQFGGATGITRGWQQTLDNYKIRYPDREAMGKLKFEIIDLTRHSKDVISLTGSWDLQRKKDHPGGHFLLIWRRINGSWKIVADHTSQRE